MDQSDRIKTAIIKARAVWKDVQQSFLDVPGLRDLPDYEKISYFFKQHQEFYNQFPIVMRYMVCLNQFRVKAFERYLRFQEVKIEDVEMKDPKFRKELIWVRQQAMYVKYLYEAYHPHCPQSETSAVYADAYASLQTEFDAFQKKIKDAKQVYQKSEDVSKVTRVKELSDVLGQRSESIQTDCLTGLRDALYKIKMIQDEKARIAVAETQKEEDEKKN